MYTLKKSTIFAIILSFLATSCSVLKNPSIIITDPSKLPVMLEGDVIDLTKTTNKAITTHFQKEPTDREKVGVYSRNTKYAIIGGVTTASAAVLTNCVINLTVSNSCLKNAGVAGAAGFVLGAAGGLIAASRQKKYESEAEAQNNKLDAARIELIQAKASRDAASRVVKEHKITIAELRKKKSKSVDEKQRLSDELKLIREDIILFNSSKDRLETEIESLQKNINEAQGEKRTFNEYVKVRDGLKKERNEMQKLINELNGLQ